LRRQSRNEHFQQFSRIVFLAIIVIQLFLNCDFEWLIVDVIGENLSANIGRRRKVVAAVEARIRIQIEPLEVPIQIDVDVPHLVFGQSIALRKALSTSIALKWLSCAHETKMFRQARLRRERALAVWTTSMSNPKCTASMWSRR
jgi:hypothetical protein